MLPRISKGPPNMKLHELLRAAIHTLAAPSMLICGSLVITGCSKPPTEPEGYRIEVLSSRPDLVTGENALVRLTVPASLARKSLAIDLNGASVVGAFRDETKSSSAATLVGYVEGLTVGTN